MNERNWLMVGIIVVVLLATIAAITPFYVTPNSSLTTTTEQSQVFYFSVLNGYSNSSTPFFQYSGQTEGVIGNVTISISCALCYYFGWLNTTAVIQNGSSTATHQSSQILNGTGLTALVVGRGNAISWTLTWRLAMVVEPPQVGTFDFVFKSPSSTIPISSLGPVANANASAEPYTSGTFSDTSVTS